MPNIFKKTGLAYFIEQAERLGKPGPPLTLTQFKELMREHQAIAAQFRAQIGSPSYQCAHCEKPLGFRNDEEWPLPLEREGAFYCEECYNVLGELRDELYEKQRPVEEDRGCGCERCLGLDEK